MVRVKAVLCHVLQLLCRNGVNLLQEGVDITFFVVMQETLGKVEGELLTVVAGNGYLSFELSLGGCQLALAQGVLHHAVEFAVHQSEASFHVVVVASEIDGPDASVAIAGHAAFDGIDQAGLLSQREVQAGVHAWSAEDVVQQVKGHAARVAEGEGAAAQHNVGLMVGWVCFPSYVRRGLWRPEQRNISFSMFIQPPSNLS